MGPLLPRPVNPLDRRTSGLVVVAKTYRAATALSQSFVDRSVRKSYVDLVINPDGNGNSNLGLSLPGEKVDPGDKGGV